MKVFGYFDEWISRFITFHKNLDMPYVWAIPLLELMLLYAVLYYVSYFIPRGTK